MPSFLAAVVATIVLAVGAAMMLQTVQETASVAYATPGARVDVH